MHPIHASYTHARTWRLSSCLPTLGLVVLLAGCGGDDPIRPNESIAFLVGNWDAQRFLVESREDPTIKLELIELGAEFSINFQPSGQYTALLVYQGNPLTEIGLVEVDGSEVVFTVTHPSPRTSRSQYALTGSRLTLTGDTEFPILARRVGRRIRDHRAHEAVTFHVEQCDEPRIVVYTTLL